jgi:hypothetical protein
MNFRVQDLEPAGVVLVTDERYPQAPSFGIKGGRPNGTLRSMVIAMLRMLGDENAVLALLAWCNAAVPVFRRV